MVNGTVIAVLVASIIAIIVGSLVIYLSSRPEENPGADNGADTIDDTVAGTIAPATLQYMQEQIDEAKAGVAANKASALTNANTATLAYDEATAQGIQLFSVAAQASTAASQASTANTDATVARTLAEGLESSVLNADGKSTDALAAALTAQTDADNANTQATSANNLITVVAGQANALEARTDSMVPGVFFGQTEQDQVSVGNLLVMSLDSAVVYKNGTLVPYDNTTGLFTFDGSRALKVTIKFTLTNSLGTTVELLMMGDADNTLNYRYRGFYTGKAEDTTHTLVIFASAAAANTFDAKFRFSGDGPFTLMRGSSILVEDLGPRS